MNVFSRPLPNLVSASATDAPATAAPISPVAPRTRAGGLRGVSAGRFYAGLIALALIVGALSLLFPSTPSYDPWAWIVWGREIVHLNLQTTGGPTWKPLPMIFTTLFAPFGQAEPNLWLLIARAGAFAAVVMAARLGYRLVRLIGTHLGDADAAPVAPALLAGVVAFIARTFGGGYISDNALATPRDWPPWSS